MTAPARRRLELAVVAVAGGATTALVSATFVMWARGTDITLAAAAALPPSLLLGVIGLASRYFCRSMPLRTSSRSTLAGAIAGSAAAASGLWIAVWQWWTPVVAGAGRVPITPDYPLLFGLGFLLYVGAVAIHYLLLEIDASREAEEAALRYRVLAREAELRAFKAQVDPHFLFNSLNAVASLCGPRPLEAREMAQRLADFFRLVLRLGALDRITLREEIELVSRYLAIEKVRFGERLTVQIDVDPQAAECTVPPLLLQPLVENAVRHGIASVVEGGTIAIGASMEERMLRIRIDNPADPDREDVRGEGIGLANARGRLHAVSEGRALLDARETEGRFHVLIELPR